jgi:uncharacterized membrane protein
MSHFAMSLGELSLLIALLLILLGVGVGLFSREGSGIDVHPRSSERDDSVGSDT